MLKQLNDKKEIQRQIDRKKQRKGEMQLEKTYEQRGINMETMRNGYIETDREIEEGKIYNRG